jgi:hypothetical protein
VRATVARMRFSSPIATTRRARCAVVTVWFGLLLAREESAPRTRWMVAPGSSGPGPGPCPRVSRGARPPG